MNERLDKELNLFWDTQLNQSEREDCFEAAKLIAEHFYTLALEDVKKEVVLLHEHACLYSTGAANMAERVLICINNLTK